ncbi:MAG: hypothetical protein F6K56_15140 [Moorea sp. SIO3G5]|nr:hypothetical protein [Moorena sp. SIO3G5]
MGSNHTLSKLSHRHHTYCPPYICSLFPIPCSLFPLLYNSFAIIINIG